MFRSIRWRIAVPYVALIVLATLGVTAFLSAQLRQMRLEYLETQLLGETRALADSAQPVFRQGASPDRLATVASAARRWAALLGGRVTLIGPDGTVLGESHEDSAQMDNHLDRPEVQQALREGHGSNIRFSDTLGYEMLYVAVPVTSGEEVIGIVRVALPLQEIEASVGRLRRDLLAIGLLVALLAALLALLIAERTARPLRRLTQVAERMAEGDLSVRLQPATRDEVGHLTLAFNYMAEQLRDKVTTLAAEQSRLTAVLDHMADGVLITDAAGRVQLVNPAAARLLGTTRATALGQSFVQVVRDHRLVELWEECDERSGEQITTLELPRVGRFLQVIVTPLLEGDTRDLPVGMRLSGSASHAERIPSRVVIMQDLTQMRRLNTVRRDFVSNLSHELRTPLASLKALVDTLRDGALDDPPAAQRFLDRVETEVDAMTQMVQELLELSRIESGQVPLHLVSTSVADVVCPPVERLHAQAERAGLSLSVELPAGLPSVLADAERARQVVTNLVHNAIKFTQPGGQVRVRAYAVQEAAGRDGEVVVEVVDTGVGIPADALPRIFERFYKADRARSGGGTGLGLAIAKHIVQGHGGRIWAESMEGRGSTFRFSLRAVK